MLFEFGKYANREIEDICKEDIGYVKWCCAQPFINDEVKDLIKANIDVEKYVMSFGKYKNKTIDHIRTVDKKYIEWLSANTKLLESLPDLQEALNNN